MKSCIPMNLSNSSVYNKSITLYQYGQEPISFCLTHSMKLEQVIELVGGKKKCKKIRLFNHKCSEIFEEDLKYLKNGSKLYVTTNGKTLDCRFILYEYNPIHLLCKGGQATVMLIQHKLTKEQRALKFICDQQTTQYLYIAREAVILEQLHHRNIVKLLSYKLFPERSEASLELEYIEGGSLLDYMLEHGPLSEQTARSIFIQLLDAISYCHKNNVIHRDLKLDNILIADKKEFKIKIIDFGLAYLSGTGIPFDEPLNVGTVLYASPEIVFGKLKTINTSVDVWALGVILYYLIFGDYPFKGENNGDILMNISEGNYIIPKQVSWELVSLITDIFNPDHGKRITIKQIKNSNWVKGIIQNNHLLSIPISDLPTTSNNLGTFENSIRKIKEDNNLINSLRSDKLLKKCTPKECIEKLLH